MEEIKLWHLMNLLSLFYIRYSATFVDWTQTELQALDRKTRKMFTMNGELHLRADVDRIYVHCNLGG